MKPLIEISTIGFAPAEIVRRLASLRAIVGETDGRFGVQIHHGATLELLDALRGDPGPFSVHGPVATDFALNLAAEDHGPAWAAFERTVEIARSFGAQDIVFHGFFLTGQAIPHGDSGFWSSLLDVLDPSIRERTGPDADQSFFNTREFHLFKERVKVTLRKLRRDFPDQKIYLKNDLPVPGAGARRPEDILFLDSPIWVDTSHLWASALVHRFDFYRALETLLDSGRVLGAHLHSNPMPLNQVNSHLHPGHGRLSDPTDMSWPRIFYMLRQHRVRRYAVEVPRCSEQDLRAVIEWDQMSTRA